MIFGGVIAAFSFAYRHLSKNFKKEKQDNANMKKGLKALLRGDIVQIYNSCIEKGCCPIFQLENAESLYEAYHELGGNGTITQLMKELREMKHTYVQRNTEENGVQ